MISTENSGPSTNCSSITLLSRDFSLARLNNSTNWTSESPFCIFAIPREPLFREGLRMPSLGNSLQKHFQALFASSKQKDFGEGALPLSNASRIRCLFVARIACNLVMPDNPNSSLRRPITFMLTSEQGWITPSIRSSRATRSTSSSLVMFTTTALSACCKPTAFASPSAAITYIPISLAFLMTGTCKMPAANTNSLFCIIFLYYLVLNIEHITDDACHILNVIPWISLVNRYTKHSSIHHLRHATHLLSLLANRP